MDPEMNYEDMARSSEAKTNNGLEYVFGKLTNT